jgi:arylsulfatase
MPTYRKGWDVLRVERFERQKKLGMFPASLPLPPRERVPVDSDAIANGYAGKQNPAWESLDADRREDLARRMATYAAMVEHVDAGIGRILADLEKHGELDNTLIIFLSDNGACYEWGPFGFDGESRRGLTTLYTGDDLRKIGQPGTHSSYGSAWANLGNTPLNLYKHFCHEGGLRSPLIVHWPASITRSGAWVNDPVHLMDVVPTVSALAGAEAPVEFKGKTLIPLEGVSLVPTFAGTALAQRTLAFEHERARGLRRGDWKIAWGKRMGGKPAWELYNLAEDPTEQHNLAKEKPELTAELAAEWMAWAQRVHVDLK